MYQNKRTLTFLFFITILSIGCRKDTMSVDINRTDPIVQVNIETDIEGYVTDNEGFPIADATVHVINEMAQTDENGYFKIAGLVGEQQAVIKVSKNGYFNQFKTLIPDKDVVSRTNIRLIEKNLSRTISSSNGGEVSIFGGSKVNFQANSFVDESGSIYDGDVSVYTFFIDPTDPELDMNMPGNMMAMNSESDLNILQSFGMVNVEIEGSSGQRLDINKSATLTVEVPISISGNAPSNIPLWYFDETIGFWIEEGEAVLIGNRYVGEVNHFTFWNCDVPSELFTLLSGQVSNDAGSPLVKVRITNTDTGQSYTDWTDNAGKFDGYVPKDAELLLEVIENCGTGVIHSETIGPFSLDVTDMGQVDISSSTDLVEIIGELTDCNGTPISNGQVVIQFLNAAFPQVVNTDANGSFSTVITVCGASEIVITAIDFDNQIITDPITYAVGPIIGLGTLKVCGTSFTESVIFTVDGATKILPGCIVSISSSGGQTSYHFNFKDSTSLGEAPVVFDWILHDRNNDLTNPDWITNNGYTVPMTINNVVEFYSNFDPSFANTEILQNATAPGDILSLKFDEVPISGSKYYQDGTIEFQGYLGTVTISATIQ